MVIWYLITFFLIDTPNLKVEFLAAVLCKGYPQADDYIELEKLATTIAEKHLADQLA
jgi:hypothetical protein